VLQSLLRSSKSFWEQNPIIVSFISKFYDIIYYKGAQTTKCILIVSIAKYQNYKIVKYHIFKNASQQPVALFGRIN